MNTREYGSLGEASAAEYLESLGYRIIGRNVHVGHDEIDILADDGEYLVFAEVKTRRQLPDSNPAFGTPASAVNGEKQRNLVRAAEGYLAAHESALTPRIDVIEVYADPKAREYKVIEIRRFENAVRKRGKFSRDPRK